MSKTDYEVIHKRLLCAEVAGDILIAEHYNQETRDSIERFFNTLPEIEMNGAPLSKEETARLLITSFLQPAIESLVNKWTVSQEVEK